MHSYALRLYVPICVCSTEQGPTPVEKKKKGKRKHDTSVESLELDQSLLSLSGLSPEESAESTDSQVSLALSSS